MVKHPREEEEDETEMPNLEDFSNYSKVFSEEQGKQIFLLKEIQVKKIIKKKKDGNKRFGNKKRTRISKLHVKHTQPKIR
jgi:hypothetical protein